MSPQSVVLAPHEGLGTTSGSSDGCGQAHVPRGMAIATSSTATMPIALAEVVKAHAHRTSTEPRVRLRGVFNQSHLCQYIALLNVMREGLGKVTDTRPPSTITMTLLSDTDGERAR